MSNYYDPWLHAIEIFFRRIFQFIFLTLVLAGVIWSAWLHFYFDADIWINTKKAVTGEAGLLKALLITCFACSSLMTGWLFSWLMCSNRREGDSHHRGARIQND